MGLGSGWRILAEAGVAQKSDSRPGAVKRRPKCFRLAMDVEEMLRGMSLGSGYSQTALVEHAVRWLYGQWLKRREEKRRGAQ